MSGHPDRTEGGFTLLEAMVALSIVAMVVIGYIGIRTQALIDGIEARNWRLARELAEEKMSELLAGAREVRPQSGEKVPFEKYQGFSFMILIGETAVSEHESNVATADTGDSDAGDRAEWQRNREAYRKASAQGLSFYDFQEQQRQEEYQRQLEDKVPSETEYEDVAVVVFFPKTEPEHEGQQESFTIKARASTLAIAGLTPEQAEQVAAARGEGSGSGATGGSGSSGGSGGNPFGGTQGGN